MKQEGALDRAVADLVAAVGRLESAVEARLDQHREAGEIDAEIRRVHADRAQLAQELDETQLRANQLHEVNREVSRRLVTAMETIRAVLER